MSRAGASSFGQETDNAAKWARTRGIEGRLLAHFRDRLLATVRPLAPTRLLDAGCGEGHVTAWLAEAFPKSEIVAVDGRAEAVHAATERTPRVHVQVADLLELPFETELFDLVVSTEVLEHLPDPGSALREFSRVSAGKLFLTVPHEPFFRAGNLARGRYLTRLGSTPGHVSAWSRRGFLRLVASEAEPVRWVEMFPWQGVLARAARRAP
jgi:2-polyprenyl-3-methyl-5-hydroxy-6-metoxy-1,4-benzoquinol methylase